MYKLYHYHYYWLSIEVAVLVGALPVGIIINDPSHVHAIVAIGLPPFMSHVRMTVELSFIASGGVCIIDGVDVGYLKLNDYITDSRSILMFRVDYSLNYITSIHLKS